MPASRIRIQISPNAVAVRTDATGRISSGNTTFFTKLWFPEMTMQEELQLAAKILKIENPQKMIRAKAVLESPNETPQRALNMTLKTKV